MKKYIIIFSIIFIAITALGIYVYNEVIEDLNVKTPSISNSIAPNKNNKPLIAANEEGNTIVVTESDLKNILSSKSYGIFSGLEVSLENNQITLKGAGKKIIKFSFEANILPIVKDEALNLKIDSFKIFGFQNNSLKDEIQKSIDEEADKHVNDHFKVYQVTIFNNQLIITGEKR